MAERGEYRAVRRVLLDGPDFQQLSERARWVFVVLKLSIGPAGIDVRYPAALPHELSEKVGAPADAVSAALDELEARGWIDREDNLLWIVGQLKHDPHMNVTDAKHRKGIWRHVGGLPRSPIVARFVSYYRDWFDAQTTKTAKGDAKQLPAAPPEITASLPAPTEGLARASEGPSKALRSTSTKTKTSTRTIDEDKNDTGVVVVTGEVSRTPVRAGDDDDDSGDGSPGAKATAVEEMRGDLAATLEQISDEAGRRRLTGKATLIAAGDAPGSWRDPRGDGGEVPWEERPPLFRLALAQVLAEERLDANAINRAMRYVLATQLDPYPARGPTEDTGPPPGGTFTEDGYDVDKLQAELR